MSYIIDNHNQNSKLLHINSEDATLHLTTEAKGSYFQFFFSSQIMCQNNERMLISLHSATIPYSFYNIRNGVNNTIPYLLEDVFTSSQYITIDGSASLAGMVASFYVKYFVISKV